MLGSHRLVSELLASSASIYGTLQQQQHNASKEETECARGGFRNDASRQVWPRQEHVVHGIWCVGRLQAASHSTRELAHFSFSSYSRTSQYWKEHTHKPPEWSVSRGSGQFSVLVSSSTATNGTLEQIRSFASSIVHDPNTTTIHIAQSTPTLSNALFRTRTLPTSRTHGNHRVLSPRSSK